MRVVEGTMGSTGGKSAMQQQELEIRIRPLLSGVNGDERDGLDGLLSREG